MGDIILVCDNIVMLLSYYIN